MSAKYIRWRVEPNFFLRRYEATVMQDDYSIIVQKHFRVRWFALLWAKVAAQAELGTAKAKKRKRDHNLSRKRSGGRYTI